MNGAQRASLLVLLACAPAAVSHAAPAPPPPATASASPIILPAPPRDDFRAPRAAAVGALDRARARAAGLDGGAGTISLPSVVLLIV
jgi:hypothetical protein